MKKLTALFLALLMMLCMIPVASAADETATQSAQILYDIGLFKGTGTNADDTPIFDLDKAPTRNQAVIMLVRLLGKEEEALAGNWELPFTDVAKGSTAYPYIGYAYANGLTSGTSATTYSGGNHIRANQYITFVLRAMGYVSGEDFQVSTAWEFSDEIGLTDGTYSATTKTFTRGDVAKISCAALHVCPKGSEQTLAEKLQADGVVDKEKRVLRPADVASAGLTFETVPTEYCQLQSKPLEGFQLYGVQYADGGNDIYFRVHYSYSGALQKFFVVPMGMPGDGILGTMVRYAAPASGVFTCKVSKDTFREYPCLAISPSADGNSGPDYCISVGYLNLTEDGTPPIFQRVKNCRDDSYEVADFKFLSAEYAPVLGGRLYRIRFTNDAYRNIQFWTLKDNQKEGWNKSLRRVVFPQAGDTEAFYFVPNYALKDYDRIYIRVRDAFAINPSGGNTQEHSDIWLEFDS